MKSDEFTDGRNFGHKDNTPADNCVIVKLLTDDALLDALQRHMNVVYPRPFTVLNPPRTEVERQQVLVVELFMRFQEILNQRREQKR